MPLGRSLSLTDAGLRSDSNGYVVTEHARDLFFAELPPQRGHSYSFALAFKMFGWGLLDSELIAVPSYDGLADPDISVTRGRTT